jgi:hypothetical protein
MRRFTMRVPALLALLVLAAAAPACKSRKPVAVDTTEAGDIPREVALQKLRELLPTMDYTYCTLPKDSLKPSEIRAWSVRSDMIEIDLGKAKPLQLVYRDIMDVKLELVGKYYTARVYTTVQTEPEKDHFQFLWKNENPAKSVVELLTSLKSK